MSQKSSSQNQSETDDKPVYLSQDEKIQQGLDKFEDTNDVNVRQRYIGAVITIFKEMWLDQCIQCTLALFAP